MKHTRDVHLVRESLRKFNRHAGVLKSDPYGLGLTLTQASALVDIERNANLRPNQLVELLNLEKSSVSRLVKVLEDGDYITVRSDPDDGRAKRLALTKRGRLAVERINAAADQYVVEAFQSLDTQERI